LLRILLFGPPQYLVHPVNTPVAELPISVVEKLAKALWMNGLVELPVRSRAAPHIPIHSCRHLGIRSRLAGAARVMHKSPDHAYFAGLPRLQKLHPRDVVRRSAPVRSDLYDAPGFSSCPDHCSTLADGVAYWLLNVDVSARPDSGDGNKRMPVIRRSNNN